jgi:hypothetical protein
MVNDQNLMRAGLRVLSALCQQSAVSTADLSMLRKAVPDLPASASLERLACEVIMRALRDRAKAAGRTAS